MTDHTPRLVVDDAAARDDDLSLLLGRLALTRADLALLTSLDASVPRSLRVKLEMADAIAAVARERKLEIPALSAMTGLSEPLAMAALDGAVTRIPAEKLMDAMVALGLHVSIMVWPAEDAPAAMSIYRPKAEPVGAHGEVVRTEGIMSGAPCFRGTRIPAETVLSYARSGQSAMDIFGDYPSLPVDAIGELARWCAGHLHRKAQGAEAPDDRPDRDGTA